MSAVNYARGGDASVLQVGGRTTSSTTAMRAPPDGEVPFTPDVRSNMMLNSRYQFVLLYTVGWDRIANAAADLNRAIGDGAFRVGDQAGLPIHRFGLDETAAAHDAVERGAVGKVLVAVAPAS